MSLIRLMNSMKVPYRLFLALVLLLLCATYSYGATPAGYSEYYIPGDETLLGTLWYNIGATGGVPSATAARHRIISVVAWSPNTKIYYDHWQDGYNFDPNNPDATADEVVVLANKGDSHTFQSANIALPQTTVAAGTCKTPGACAYTGKDHIYVAGGLVSVTTESWVESIGNVFTIAWEVYPVKPQMTTYILPFGEDLAAAPRNYRSFDRVFALVQATEDNTTVQIDFNQDGTWDTFCTDKTRATCTPGTSVTLNKGEVFLLDDTAVSPQASPYNIVHTGTLIKASATVQVDYVIGNHNDNYQGRGFSAFPRGYWDTEYYSPVDSSNGTTQYPTNIYIYNPNTATLNIAYQTTTGTGTFTVPAGQTRSLYEQAGTYVPQGSGIYLKGDNVFWGISNMDDGGQTHEWGYGLIPAFLLGKEQFIGWAPAGAPMPVGAGDYHDGGIYITPAQDNTRIFVDTNNDGTADYTYTLNRMQTQYIYNTVTGDMSNSHIWATGPISLAYGQNPALAPAAAPAVDLGYSILPGGDWTDKVLTVTKTTNPVMVGTTAGSQSTYTLSVNSYYYDVQGINVTDYLPSGWQYVPNSTTITLADKTQISGAPAEPDNSSPKKYRDNFGTQVYNNNGDNLPAGTTWTTNWIEQGETSQSATAGNIQIVNDTGVTPNATYALRFANNGDAIARMANLPSNVGITLDFDYRRVLTATTQYVDVQVCQNATNASPITCSAGWQTVVRITGTGTDAWYQHYHTDLTSFLSSTPTPVNFAIRFSSIGSNAGGTNYVYFDNIQVAAALTWPSSMLGNMAPNQNITIQFTAQTTQAFNVGDLTRNDVQASGSRTVAGLTQTFVTSDFAYNSFGNITVSKTSSAVDPVYPGNQFTYTVTVTNPSATALTGLSVYDPLPDGVSYAGGGSVTCELTQTAQNVRDEFATVAYTNNGPNNTANWASNWTETDIYGSGATGATGGRIWITGGQLQFRYLLANVNDSFNTNGNYGGNDGTNNWNAAWVETNDDNSANSGNILVTNHYLRFRPGTADRSVSRTATVAGASSATINFSLTDQSIVAGETVVVEYQLDSGSWVNIGTLDGGTGWSGNALPFTIALNNNNSLTIRFRAPQAWSGTHEARVDNVDISFGMPGTQIRRTANLAGAASATLSFSYTAANLVAGDTVVVEASADGTNFTTLDTLNGLTGTGTKSYDLVYPTNYASANTTIRLRITSGFNATNKTLSVDNVNISYTVFSTFAASSSPNFLLSGTGCFIRPGNSLTLTYNVTVDNPLDAGIDQITNTAYINTNEIPLPFSASATNLVVNPSSGSAEVSGRVWFDINGNGAIDVGEPGLANVEATLKDQYGTPLMTTTTDAAGHYLFTGMEAGNGYYVELTSRTIPSGLQQSAPGGHSDNRTNSLNVIAGQSYTDADLGYKSPAGSATVMSMVWSDANSNGIRDAGEAGIAGVTVQLCFDANGNGVWDPGEMTGCRATVTAADGSYLFTGIPASGTQDYFVYVDGNQTTLTEYTQTAPASDPLYINNLSAGDVIQYANFGYYGYHNGTPTTYSIKDRVWFDSDGNGLVNGSESGIAGVTVDLLDASLNAIATATTDASGYFTFSGVVGGGADYTVRITDINSKLTNYFGTTNSAKTGTKQVPNVTGNVDYSGTPDFGYGLKNSVLGTVFNDLNNNGTLNSGEPGISGVVVKLYNDANGNGRIDAGTDTVQATLTTDSYGNYIFSGLSNGNYIVSIESPPNGYTYNVPPSPADSDSVTGGQQRAANISGNGNISVNFGYYAAAARSVSGTLWDDANNNGVKDAGETGIAGVTISLLQGGNTTATTTTATDGSYSFTGLPNGTYTVTITDTAGVLSGDIGTYEKTEGTVGPFNGQEIVNLSSGNLIGIDFGYVNPAIPTLAVLTSFSANEQDGKVIVQWETASEHNTLGFYVLRLDPAAGGYQSISSGLLPGLLTDPRGGSYTLVDTGATPGGVYRYKLVEVERNGRQITYGPFTVQVTTEDETAANILTNSSTESTVRMRALHPSTFTRQARAQSILQKTFAQARKVAVASQSTPKMHDSQVAPTRGSRIKIPIKETGLYYMDAGDISAITGINRAIVKSMILLHHIAVSNQGQPVAYLPAQNYSGIYFYGTGTDNAYTRDNIYWIDTSTTGLAMKNERTLNPFSVSPGETFTDNLHIEQDVIPNMSQTNDPSEDYWAWNLIFLSASYSDGPETFTFSLTGKADTQATATLQVHLVGGSDSGMERDHHVVVSLNGQQIGEGWWTGLDTYTLTADFDQSLLNEGENTIEVKGVLDKGIPSSMFLIDSFDLVYERIYNASDNRLFFTGDGNNIVTVGGFTSTNPDILLLNITDPMAPKVNVAATIDGNPGNYEISFRPASPNARYLAISTGASVRVVNAVGVNPPNLRTNRNMADYLIITTGELMSSAQPLASYRGLQGMKTMVVNVDDIMNEFNFGISSPEAIRQFLTYAYHNWRKAPAYVLLAGAGTWDYRDNMGAGGNLIPPALVPTPYGLSTSDNHLADVDGDHVPDMAIGRLPVLSAQDLQDVTAKIKTFEGTAGNKVILLADRPDDGGDFSSDSEAIAGLFPASYILEKVYLGEYASADTAGKALSNDINGGAVFMNYIGHAAPDMFSAEELLTSDDIDALINGSGLPIVTAMTCTAGEFAIPGYPSMSQLMVLKSDGGAAAFWSSTGLSDNSEAGILDREFYNAVFSGNKRTLGDAVLGAFDKYRTSGSMPFMTDIYTVLGDPALRLK